jgi:preprotein translocase subunit SecG
MGVRRTADFLEKATYTLAIVLLVLSLLSSANINKSGTASEGPAAASSEVKQKSQETPLNNIPSGMPTKLNQQKPLTPPATEPNPKKP